MDHLSARKITITTRHSELDQQRGRIIQKWKRTLLKPLACRYHSFTELSVDFRERSNINSIATASLHTSGSMLTNSR